jgi:hypothetical protein
MGSSLGCMLPLFASEAGFLHKTDGQIVGVSLEEERIVSVPFTRRKN